VTGCRTELRVEQVKRGPKGMERPDQARGNPDNALELESEAGQNNAEQASLRRGIVQDRCHSEGV
jgi:hypothetical protein